MPPTLQFFEKIFAYLQGKGYGSQTIDKEVKVALRLLGRPPKTVLDVGANMGLWTKSLLARYPDTEVHAFEPQPLCYYHLQGLYAGHPNVYLHNNAVSNTAGNRTLHFDREGSGLASLSKRKLDHLGIDFSGVVEVRTIILDDFMRVACKGQLDIVKLDIEGHEMAAFEGLTASLQSSIPPRVIQFEFGGCNIETRTYFRDFYFMFRERYFIYRQTPFGLYRLDRYSEADECFRTTNYFMRLKD